MPFGLELTAFSNVFTYLTAFFGAFLAALWLSLIFWTYRDIRSRTHDRLAQIFAALVVAILNLPGMVIYFILRPARTLDETYQAALEEEALLSQVEERSGCPGCGARTRQAWMICPHCHTKLKKKCKLCGRLMELPWQVCPYCGEPTYESTDESTPAPLPTTEEV